MGSNANTTREDMQKVINAMSEKATGTKSSAENLEKLKDDQKKSDEIQKQLKYALDHLL